MDQELIQLIARLFSIAGSKGLTVNNPVNVVLEAPSSYENTQVIIRHDEPHNVTAPLNIVWLVSDEESPDYGKTMKRSSRIAQAPYTHSWTELLTYIDIFEPPQVWDTQKPLDQDHIEHGINIDNPHRTTAAQIAAVPIAGGTMEGPLNIRSGTSIEDYGEEEALPKSFIKTALDTIAAHASSNDARLGGVSGAINYIINTLIRNVRNRVTTLEETVNSEHETRITHLEQFTGAPGFAYEQELPEINWNVTHALNSLHVLVQVFDTNNVMLIPAAVEILGVNSINVSFAIPVTGFVRIQALSSV